jgi:SAM-dependent methyltransferase
MKDVLGQAIHDYHHQNSPGELWIHNRYGPKEPMPIEAYFRDEDDMPDLEWHAMNECRGRVLDVGAGAGSHALELQNRNYDVTALDISPLAVAVMQERGVKHAIAQDIYSYMGEKFDTILLLMNGIGLAGNLKQLSTLLHHFKTLLAKGGQLMFDSSDITYLYEGNMPETGYYGEIQYQYEYKGETTEWFEWLYIDEAMLITIANEAGWDVEVLYEDEFKQFLARLTTKK